MFAGTLRAGKSISGYLSRGFVEVHNLQKRHDDLARELESRGYSHNSPLLPFPISQCGTISEEVSIQELRKRCPECKQRIDLATPTEQILCQD